MRILTYTILISTLSNLSFANSEEPSQTQGYSKSVFRKSVKDSNYDILMDESIKVEPMRKTVQSLSTIKNNKIKALLKSRAKRKNKFSSVDKLGYASACKGNRSSQYKCFKNNIKIFHENVFGYWGDQKDKAELKYIYDVDAVECELLDVSEKVALGSTINKCATDSVGVNKLSSAQGNKYCALKTANKSFKKKFCSGNKLKSFYQKNKNLSKAFAAYKIHKNKMKQKVIARFESELKAYKANTKWFTLKFMKELLSEQGELKQCIASTKLTQKRQKSCFYSSMDIAQCLSDSTFKVKFSDENVVSDSFLLRDRFYGGVDTFVSQDNLRRYYKCGHSSESQSSDSRAQVIVESPKGAEDELYVPGSDSQIFRR